MGSKQGKGGQKSAGAPKDIPSLAKYIQSGKCRKLGAGISTAAGIPDFRSPETGLYSNLARLNLPHPEAVFEIGFFRRNPVPFYTLAQELYPGKFRPTKSHSFIRLLHAHRLLHICFTQNIDTLERRAGIPDDKIVEAHGSFATQRCIECKRPYDDEDMKRCIKDQRIPRCEECNGLVKPDIVFFGESLPKNFIGSLPDLITADLLIIMGTSLTVHPFATLAGVPSETTPRVLINLDRVGDIGSMPVIWFY
ncbi:DHS-like NAD/FAD-binding domain-containing protein [Infundibulicybe gibba]|nr:DHS-like NAD/FAD-binding domain-containing protein [Infundibulicybe gibba]